MSKLNRIRKAFSLVELAIVILITGILIAFVMQANDMIRSFKIMGARSLTKSSIINSIPGIVAWFDTTSEKSFLPKESINRKKISLWRDINSQSTTRNDASQDSNAKPIYTFDPSVGNGLPVLRFDGSAYFKLPDGTIPPSNYDYTIFLTILVQDTWESYGVLGSGDYSTQNGSNIIAYRAGGFVENNWQKNTLLTPTISISAGRMQILSFLYDNTKGRKIYVNSAFKAEDNERGRDGIPNSNTIGKVSIANIPDLYFKGDIGEIIIFGRALSKEERQNVEKYLAKKWGISL